tara:strand:+ start:983 stop:1153 length:171 start_codon:yes stop_codon:yes gene_type:complete
MVKPKISVERVVIRQSFIELRHINAYSIFRKSTIARSMWDKKIPLNPLYIKKIIGV